MKSKITPSGIVITISAAAIAAYYFFYMLLCFAGIDAPSMAFFAIIVIAAVLLPIFLRKKLNRILKKGYYPLKIIFAVLLLAYIISVVGFWCYIGFDSTMTPEAYLSHLAEEETGDDTIIMVFGCRAYGLTPGDTLKIRLDNAYTLLCALPDSLCVVSGGQGNNETLPEALAMKDYLTNLGIESNRIITEPESHSTSENIRFTKSLLLKMGLSHKKIIGVSTAFHLPRISMLSDRYDLPMELCAAPHVSPAYHYVSMVREYLSYIKMAIFG